VLNRVLENLGESFIVDKTPVMEGRMMSMFISPKSKR
jgi:translation initiation factor IF-3